MKLSETIRVAEKAKAWLDRFPEYRAAIDELIKLARTQTGEPEPSRAATRTSGLFGRIGDELRKAADEFTESMFDLPPCTEDTAPAPEPQSREAFKAAGRVADPDYPHRTYEEKAVDALHAGFADGWMQARTYYGRTEEGGTVHGAECASASDGNKLCTCAEAVQHREAHEAAAHYYAPAPKPAAPQPGDEVADYEAAIKLPVGTLIKGPSGVRGLVVAGLAGPVVRWAGPDGTEQFPATIVDVNVP